MLEAPEAGRAEEYYKSGAGRGLDWLNLFVANVQTGFGPFISVYLTTEGWTQTAIGVALSIGTFAAMASQIPAGALVDAIRSKTRVAALSVVAFAASAMMFTVAPVAIVIYLAQILHSFSSCTLGPAIAALSRRIAGHGELGVRLGRNARYLSIGNATGALLMGGTGYLVSERAVFFITSLLTLPALLALMPIARYERRTRLAKERPSLARREPLSRVLGDRRLLVFAASAALFTLANAALLPLVSVVITKSDPGSATLIIAAAIILPQLVVAIISPSVGRLAERYGRRPVLIVGFAIVPVRGLLLAATSDPLFVLPIQLLDGIAAASFGVLVPLVTSDIAGQTGRFNVSLGLVGFAIGVGATLSTTGGGLLADRFGDWAAFVGLGGAGIVGLTIVYLAMTETRPAPPAAQGAQ